MALMIKCGFQPDDRFLGPAAEMDSWVLMCTDKCILTGTVLGVPLQMCGTSE